MEGRGKSGRERFLSTPSARRATRCPNRQRYRHRNFYPRPPRGGRLPARQEPLKGAANISIHALREEGDGPRYSPRRRPKISIHALREEGDGQVSFL